MANAAPHFSSGKSARAALLLSVVIHIGLVLAFVFFDVPTHPDAQSLQASELVVVVEDGESGKGHGVTLAQVEAPVPVEPVVMPRLEPVRHILAPRLVDDPMLQGHVDAGAVPAIHQVTGETEPEAGGGPSLFGALAKGRSVVYVLDRSMSMGLHDGLRQARAELVASLSRLPAGTPFQVIAYNQFAEPLSVRNYAGLLTANADTIAEVGQAIAALRAVGNTNHLQALRRGLEFQTDVLFFITDADELNADDIRFVTALNGGRCSIHVIDVGPHADDGDSALRRLAAQNRGTYRHVAVKEL